jgi:methyltransferase
MITAGWFTALVIVVGLERLAELIVARRNRAWALSRGGVEYGAGHYPLLVALHLALLGGSLVEVWLRRPEFLPVLGATMLGLVIAAQALRWWCIRTLGRQWNTRIIVVPGLSLVRAGPYRWLRHPNYLAVVVEGVALPLVHSAVITAIGFTALNLIMLSVRIRTENGALRESQDSVG